MSSLWIKNGKLVVSAAGKLILCDDCPCEEGETVPGCCDLSGDSTPKVITYTAGALSQNVTMHKFSATLWLGGREFASGIERHVLDVQVNCSGGIHTLIFSFTEYISDVRERYTEWFAQAAGGADAGDWPLKIHCVPYHAQYTGMNTSAGGGTPENVVRDGYTFMYVANAGDLNLNFDLA